MRGLLVILVGIACVIPSLSHNVIRGHQWVPVTAHGGLNFFLGNNPASNGYGIAIPGIRTSAEEMIRDSQNLASRLAGASLTPSEASRFWRQRAFEFWRHNPMKALTLLVRKLHRLISVKDFDDTGLCRLLPETVPLLRHTKKSPGTLMRRGSGNQHFILEQEVREQNFRPVESCKGCLNQALASYN